MGIRISSGSAPAPRVPQPPYQRANVLPADSKSGWIDNALTFLDAGAVRQRRAELPPRADLVRTSDG